MLKRIWKSVLGAIAIISVQGTANADRPSPLTLDAHIDISAQFDGEDGPASIDGQTQFDLAKADRGGLGAAALAVFAPQSAETPQTLATAQAIAQAKYRTIAGLASRYPEKVGFARTPADVRAIVAAGRFAVIAGIVNGGAFIENAADIDAWADKGIAFFGFVHAGHNRLADSSRPALVRGESVSKNGGLSPLGEQAVDQLNRRGVVIDISQLSDVATGQVLTRSRAPVIASHSDVRGLVDNGRNLSDGQLDLLKANGGVIAINAFSAYLRPRDAAFEERLSALKTEYGLDKEGGRTLPADRAAEYDKRYHDIRATEPRADLNTLIDAVDYVVRRIGIDHVGLSSDFNHGGGITGWDSVADTQNVTQALARRGYSKTDIAKIWSGNVLRVWQQAIDIGARLRREAR